MYIYYIYIIYTIYINIQGWVISKTFFVYMYNILASDLCEYGQYQRGAAVTPQASGQHGGLQTCGVPVVLPFKLIISGIIVCLTVIRQVLLNH